MVKICKHYYYEHDGNCFILHFRCIRNKIDIKTKTETNEKIKSDIVMGYYTSISSMLSAVAIHITNRKIENGTITTIEEHINELKALKDQLKEMVGE